MLYKLFRISGPGSLPWRKTQPVHSSICSMKWILKVEVSFIFLLFYWNRLSLPAPIGCLGLVTEPEALCAKLAVCHPGEISMGMVATVCCCIKHYTTDQVSYHTWGKGMRGCPWHCQSWNTKYEHDVREHNQLPHVQSWSSRKWGKLYTFVCLV